MPRNLFESIGLVWSTGMFLVEDVLDGKHWENLYSQDCTAVDILIFKTAGRTRQVRFNLRDSERLQRWPKGQGEHNNHQQLRRLQGASCVYYPGLVLLIQGHVQ